MNTNPEEGAMHAPQSWRDTLLSSEFPACAAGVEPTISVLMVSGPTQQGLLARLMNLVASAARGGTPLELIILDETSDHSAALLLQGIEFVRVVAVSRIEGQAAALNVAAGLARGQGLFIMSNEVELLAGAIQAAADAVDLFDDVGIVGLRLITPQGRLRHAGGRFIGGETLVDLYLPDHADPEAPEALFARDCSYVEGAAFLVERALFRESGGVDTRCWPGLYGMADLCIRCLRAGKRVVYQPHAAAICALFPDERVEFGKRAAFLEHHAETLTQLVSFRPGLHGRERDEERLRVLYIDDFTPHQDAGAGFPRANSIINTMARLGYGVTVYPVIASDDLISDRYRDISPVIELLTGSGADGLLKILDERSQYYDLIWVSRPHNIALVLNTFLRRGVSLRDWVRSSIIFDTEAVFASRDALIRHHEGVSIRSDVLQAAIRAELAPGLIADKVVCVSEAEARMLRAFGKLRNVDCLGHAVDVKPGEAAFTERNGLVFVGALKDEDSPNADSILWFLDHVWPIVVQRLGDSVQFRIVGAINETLRERFSRKQVSILGKVANLEDVFNRSRVAVAPTRFAAGIPHKVHESISLGVPIVITPLLAAELEWREGAGFLSAPWQAPEQFAEAICQLYEQENLWQTIREQGLMQIAQACSPEHFERTLKRLCEESFLTCT